MATAQLAAVLRHIGSLAADQERGDQTDGALLRAFLSNNDQQAFETLVRRHGPMVLRVCRRTLGNAHDAEDALQATFLLLARRGTSIRKKQSLASWLHGVAYRMATDARRAAARRRKHESRASPAQPPDPALSAAWQELQVLLDDEIGRLPETLREPFISCCLENRSCAEAAQQLGLEEGAVRKRLSRARKRLQERLTRRGVALAAVLAAVAVGTRGAAAGLPGSLVGSTVKAAAQTVAGQTLACGLVPAQVLTLVKGANRAMFLSKARTAVLLLLSTALVGAGALAHQVLGAKQPEARQQTEPQPAAGDADRVGPEGERPARTDRYGDPLPEGAIARLGTVRFRHGSTVTGLAYAPDGKTLVSGSYDKTLRVWDTATGREVHRLPPARGSVFGLNLSRDGKTVAAVDMGDLYLGDPTAGRLTRLLPQPVEYHTCVALSPDGKSLAAGCWDMTAGSFTVRLWEAGTLRPLHTCLGHTGKVDHAAFSPDGKTLATAGEDGTVRLWDVAAGTETLRLEGKQPVRSLAFAGDGRLLAAGSEDGKLRLWELPAGKLRHEIGHPIAVEAIAFAPDGKALAAAGGGNALRLWDPDTGKELRCIWTNPGAVAFAPDGRTLASGGSDCAIRFWDVATGKECTRAGPGQRAPVRALCVSADGKLVATGGGDDRTICLWETATGKEVRRLKADTPWIAKLALSPDGKVVASNGGLWDTATGRVLGRFRDQDYGIEAMAFAPDGRTLAMATRDVAPVTQGRMIRLWDAAGVREVRHFGEQPVHALAYSPDGKALAAGNGDGTISLWDAASGKETRRFPAHRREVWSVAFSPDGKALASSTFDGDIFLWDPATGKQLGPLVRDGAPQPIAVAFSPDGRMLASAEQPYSSPRGDCITLWELATGRVRLRLAGHQGDVNCLAFAGDAKTLVTGSTDTKALVWDVTIPLHPAGVGDLSRAELETFWGDLRAAEADRGYRAVCALAASPAGVRCLGRHLAPARPPDTDRLTRLVRDLDGEEFGTRDRARQELERLGETAEPALRKMLAGRPSPEVRRRLNQFLDDLSAEWLRTRRAVEALELSGTPEARELLQALEAGAADARPTQEAKASLERLARRAAAMP